MSQQFDAFDNGIASVPYYNDLKHKVPSLMSLCSLTRSFLGSSPPSSYSSAVCTQVSHAGCLPSKHHLGLVACHRLDMSGRTCSLKRLCYAMQHIHVCILIKMICSESHSIQRMQGEFN